jgi:hypothetical protein
MASIVFPLLPIAFILALICCHFCARGISNAIGALASVMLMGLAAFVAFGAGVIGPDQKIGQWYVGLNTAWSEEEFLLTNVMTQAHSMLSHPL